MTKFKVGDRVRRIDYGDQDQVSGTVWAVETRYCVDWDTDGDSVARVYEWREGHLEAAPPILPVNPSQEDVKRVITYLQSLLK